MHGGREGCRRRCSTSERAPESNESSELAIWWCYGKNRYEAWKSQQPSDRCTIYMQVGRGSIEIRNSHVFANLERFPWCERFDRTIFVFSALFVSCVFLYTLYLFHVSYSFHAHHACSTWFHWNMIFSLAALIGHIIIRGLGMGVFVFRSSMKLKRDAERPAHIHIVRGWTPNCGVVDYVSNDDYSIVLCEWVVLSIGF